MEDHEKGINQLVVGTTCQTRLVDPGELGFSVSLEHEDRFENVGSNLLR